MTAHLWFKHQLEHFLWGGGRGQKTEENSGVEGQTNERLKTYISNSVIIVMNTTAVLLSELLFLMLKEASIEDL